MAEPVEVDAATAVADVSDPASVTESDVVVVGGGPAGCAAAETLCRSGHTVTLIDRRPVDGSVSFSDVLSPRAVAELASTGLDQHDLERFHAVDGVRIRAGTRSVECAWPSHPPMPAHGYVARRDQLDSLLLQRLSVSGVQVLSGHEATTPLVERGFARGATVTTPDGRSVDVRGRYLVVADGATSRFGRALGTYRRRAWPFATAIRARWATPRHAERTIECSFDLTGRDGGTLTGYGWVFPQGDGSAGVGVGVLSTSREFGAVNTSELLQRFVRSLRDDWELDPDRPLVAATGGRIPVGGSVGPAAGPSHLVVGDAGGFVHPLTGAGVEYALATGRLAGEILAEALGAHDPTALQRYPTELAAAFAEPFKIGRLLGRFAGRPFVMRRSAQLLARRHWAAEGALRIGLDTLRTGQTGAHPGGAERVYRAARAIARFAPDA